MREIWKNLKIWQKVALLVGGLLIVVIIVIAVVSIINSEPKVKIEFGVEENIPAEELRGIREYLSGVIKDNTVDFSSGTIYVGKARKYEEEVYSDSTTATFIVDFDDIRQSYLVTVTWPNPDDGSPNISVSCPILDSKYPETECVTEANSSTDIISYLPYEGMLKNGKKYKVEDNYGNGGFYLTVSVDACGDTVLLEGALEAAKEWITSINLNPDDYLFFVPTSICEGIASSEIPYSYIIANHAKTNDENVNKYLPYFIPNMYNVYPVVDENNNVTKIEAEVSGCTDYQTDPMERAVHDYLDGYGISYPVEFEYCVE